MRKSFLLLFALIALLGCGGDGDNGFGGSVGESFVRRFVDALNSESVSRVSALISNNYYEDCDDKDDFLNDYRANLNDGFRYNLEVVDVWDEERNGDFAVFMVRLRNRDNGATDQFPVYIRNENGTWRLYGNQDCGLTSTKPGQSTTEHTFLRLKSQ